MRLGFLDTILKYDVPYIVIMPQRYIKPTAKEIMKEPIMHSNPLRARFYIICFLIAFELLIID